MDAPGDRISKLWVEDEAAQEQRGELFDARTQLVDAYNIVSTLPSLARGFEQHNGSLISPVVTMEVDSTPYAELNDASSYTYNLKARRTDTQDIYIAVEQKPDRKGNVSDNEVHEYIINFNGTVVKSNELDPGDQPRISAEELDFVKSASNKLAWNIADSGNNHRRLLEEKARYRAEERRERTQRVVRKFFATTGVLVLAGGVATGGYVWWNAVDQANKADEAKRDAFDAEGNVIDSQSIELDDQRFVLIPKEDFADIPSFRTGDSLESPRTVLVGDDYCATIAIDGVEDKDLKIGVSQHNPIGEYPVVAFKTDTLLKVCLTEEPNSEISDDDEKIAVQLVDSND